MTFLNPIGLLALLSIPVIIFFHYFRQQRKNKKIGGIHLWDFARVESPTGANYDKLVKNLPLILQILAAIFLSLLLAGFHIPLSKECQTVTMIVDDSVSMQASDGNKTSMDRLVDVLDNKTGRNDLLTVVSAGTSPKVIVGPNESKANSLKILKIHKPKSPVANFSEALNLAEKLSESNNIYYFTDNPDTDKDNHSVKSVIGVGKSVNNISISYAERYKNSEKDDEIFLTIRSYSKSAEKAPLTIAVGKQIISTDNISLEASQTLNLKFKIPSDTPPIDVNLSNNDALSLDNHIKLMSPAMRNVSVYIDDFGSHSPNFIKAVKSVNNTSISGSPEGAQLLFLKSSNSSSHPNAVKYYFQDRNTSSSGITIPGNLLTKGIDTPIAEKVPLEGVLWNIPNQILDSRSALAADLSYTSIPLIYKANNTRRNHDRRVNINLDKSNITRTPAWPTLIQAIIEDCRSNLPGLSRSNYYVGEDIVLNLTSQDNSQYFLQKDGSSQPFAQYENTPPQVIKNLPAGTYDLVQKNSKGSAVIAAFQLNLFSDAESNILDAKSTLENLIQLESTSGNLLSDNPWVFYSLLLLTIVSIMLAWRYHDVGL